ncbi:hypothetical protein AAG570_008934 [Ranatra chinensis]|uniref:Uncharacterized protein n=1 Tax=Ranatra chinensis TaxID=642074 RepID=A0ABD0YSE3_9HEMI
MASKRRNRFEKNTKREATEIDTSDPHNLFQMMSSNEQEIASLLPAFMFDNDDDIYALSITRLRRLGSSLSMLAQDCNLVSKEVDLRIIRLFLISEGLPQADQEIIELLRAILRNDVRPKQTLCKFCEREDSLKKYMASIGIVRG